MTTALRLATVALLAAALQVRGPTIVQATALPALAGSSGALCAEAAAPSHSPLRTPDDSAAPPVAALAAEALRSPPATRAPALRLVRREPLDRSITPAEPPPRRPDVAR
ncbi:MAG: hypothetical protein HY903_16605 [Deltaproteobacteria bacterium]|nr:hypothetical protein [Deltaproteobacteria bacterium]